MSLIAVARTRDAMYNSWDKNDPKHAQVILHLMKTGTTQRYLDPLVTGHQDLQELANTYQQVSLRKVRLQHSIKPATCVQIEIALPTTPRPSADMKRLPSNRIIPRLWQSREVGHDPAQSTRSSRTVPRHRQ